MMILSVLFITISLQLAQSRRLIDDMDNEVSVNPAGNLQFSDQHDWVKINKPPKPVMERNVGDHIEFKCEAMGSPPPTIQWYKRNLRITENQSFKQEEEMQLTNQISETSAGLAIVVSRLVVNYVLPRHQDVYRCVAQSGSTVASAPTKLNVLNKEGREMNFTQLVASKILGAHHMPRVTFWASNYMDDIGSEAILPCKSVGNPKPTLMWIDPNSRRIVDDNKFSILPDGELRIQDIQWSDMGVYNCVVENLIGVDSVETFLYPMESSRN